MKDYIFKIREIKETEIKISAKSYRKAIEQLKQEYDNGKLNEKFEQIDTKFDYYNANSFAKNMNSNEAAYQISRQWEEIEDVLTEFERVQRKASVKLGQEIARRKRLGIINESIIDGQEVCFVEQNALSNYVEQWGLGNKLPLKAKLLYCQDEDKFVAVDNTTGNCWVEEFSTEQEVFDWLLGKDENYSDEMEL